VHVWLFWSTDKCLKVIANNTWHECNRLVLFWHIIIVLVLFHLGWICHFCWCFVLSDKKVSYHCPENIVLVSSFVRDNWSPPTIFSTLLGLSHFVHGQTPYSQQMQPYTISLDLLSGLGIMLYLFFMYYILVSITLIYKICWCTVVLWKEKCFKEIPKVVIM